MKRVNKPKEKIPTMNDITRLAIQIVDARSAGDRFVLVFKLVYALLDMHDHDTLSMLQNLEREGYLRKRKGTNRTARQTSVVQ